MGRLRRLLSLSRHAVGKADKAFCFQIAFVRPSRPDGNGMTGNLPHEFPTVRIRRFEILFAKRRCHVEIHLIGVYSIFGLTHRKTRVIFQSFTINSNFRLYLNAFQGSRNELRGGYPVSTP